jgi:hypothetical protein
MARSRTSIRSADQLRRAEDEETGPSIRPDDPPGPGITHPASARRPPASGRVAEEHGTRSRSTLPYSHPAHARGEQQIDAPHLRAPRRSHRKTGTTSQTTPSLPSGSTDRRQASKQPGMTMQGSRVPYYAIRLCRALESKSLPFHPIRIPQHQGLTLTRTQPILIPERRINGENRHLA